LNIIPYSVVLPSRAFTLIGVGATQPAAFNLEMSAFAIVVTTCPSLASRSTVTGGVVGVEYASTKVLPPGDISMVWSASSGVSSVVFPLSMSTLKNCL
jgi:hypothetical protein